MSIFGSALRTQPFAVLAVAGTLAGASALPAAAQVLPPEPDQIVLQLRAEGWVETRTAKVTATVNAASQGADAGKVRADALKALGTLADKAEWRIVAFNRASDSAGLERTDIVAEARLPEAGLGGLADKAKAASKPGMQVALAGIDFTPTLAEREAVLSALREEIYAHAMAELARANAKVPGRSYRIRLVDFAGASMPRPMPRMARQLEATAAPMMAMAADAGDGVAVAQLLTVQASVVLAAEPPK